MESNFENQPAREAARNAFESIADDRDRIGARMTAETWWAAPAQGLGAALLVGAPIAGLQWMWLPSVLSVLIFLGIEYMFRKRSGLTISRPAGPRGLALLLVFGFLLAGALVANSALAIFGLQGWALGLATLTGIMAAFMVVAYDRTYAAEVRGGH